MNILIELPGEIVQEPGATWREVLQKMLEALAIEAYRAGIQMLYLLP
jgi:hypothetical protein